MQISQIRDSVNQASTIIGRANSMARSEGAASLQLQQNLQELERKSTDAQEMLADGKSVDQARIVECIDELEQIGDSAKRASQASGTDPQVRNAVEQVHDKLSELKHELH